MLLVTEILIKYIKTGHEAKTHYNGILALCRTTNREYSLSAFFTDLRLTLLFVSLYNTFRCT